MRRSTPICTDGPNGLSGLRLGDLHHWCSNSQHLNHVFDVDASLEHQVDVDPIFQMGSKRSHGSPISLVRCSCRPIKVWLSVCHSAFKRLLWFDLLTTAYLDMRGALKPTRKRIQLAYYDARDITFDDIGLAPQLLESLDGHAEMAYPPSTDSLTFCCGSLSEDSPSTMR